MTDSSPAMSPLKMKVVVFLTMRNTFALIIDVILDFAGTFTQWSMTAISILYQLLLQWLLHPSYATPELGAESDEHSRNIKDKKAADGFCPLIQVTSRSRVCEYPGSILVLWRDDYARAILMTGLQPSKNSSLKPNTATTI